MRSLLLLFVTLAIISSSEAQKSKEFTREWKSVDSLTDLGQPKSALQIVNRIYDESKKDGNDAQFVKAVIQKIRLENNFREDPQLNSIYDLKKEIRTAKPPVLQILTSLLAAQYENYLDSHRWQFQNRTTVAGQITDSVNTWDINTLNAVVMMTYRKSLEGEKLLKSIPVETLEVILKKEDEGNKRDQKDKDVRAFRPTLYDLLIWRALDYFTGENGARNLPSTGFLISSPDYLLPANKWLSLPPAPFDSSSMESNAIRLFHDLTTFHANDKDPRALINIEIERISYVHEKGAFSKRDSLYILALKNIENLYKSSPWSTDISFALASFLFEQGRIYEPRLFPGHKWQLKEALDVCNEAISRFPQSEGAQKCRNLMQMILQKMVTINTESAVIPGKTSPGQIISKNTDKIFFRLVKADPEEVESKTAGMNQQEKISWFSSLPVFKTWSMTIVLEGDHQQHKTGFEIPALPSGFYYLISSTGENLPDTASVVVFTPLTSSMITYISRQSEKKGLQVYILDRETGKPLKNAEVETFIKRYDNGLRGYKSVKTGSYKADENGFLSLDSPGRKEYYGFYMKIRYKDEMIYSDHFYLYPSFREEEKEVISTALFTDRAIYRPGQTIYFKGIVIRTKGKSKEIVTGKSITITLIDVNSQKVAEKTFTTSEFGSFNGSFSIPSSGLKGRMSLSTSTGSVGFSVEEYKRPTFEVTMDPAKGNYRLKDSIRITGKATAYAGNAVSSAKVTYRVFRTPRYLWDKFWIPQLSSTIIEIADGTVTTASDGTFAFSFVALPDFTTEEKDDVAFTYEIRTDVTDLNGETQSGQEYVSAGYRSLVLFSDVPENYNLKKDSVIKIIARNLNDQPVPVTMRAEVLRLKQPDQMLTVKKWETEDYLALVPVKFPEMAGWSAEKTVFSEDMNTATDTMIRLQKKSSDLKPGAYRMILASKDPYGNTITDTTNFIIFDPDTKESPLNAAGWFAQITKKAEPGESAFFLAGTKEKDVNLMYEMAKGDSVYFRQWIHLSNEMKKIELPVKEEYRGGFTVNFLFVKNNGAYQESYRVEVPFTNKKLDIQLETFRNRIVPGGKEEWKIKISGPGGKSEPAEFLASMYDASLDAFVEHSWAFNPWTSWEGAIPWQVQDILKASSFAGYSIYKEIRVPEREYEELEDINQYGYRGRLRRGGRFESPMMATSDAVVEEKVMAEAPPSAIPPPMDAQPNPVTPPASKPAPVPVKIRSDFRETAFFYPSLVTDSTGSVFLKFTAPESLTRWKLMGLAHSKDLKTGMITKETVTQKDLMVFPNAPRFVRQGDTLIFSAKIVNLADGQLYGESVLEITDPVSGAPLPLLQNGELKSPSMTQQFTIPAGQSTSLNWKLVIPVDPSLSMLQYRITAIAGTFSDGEEKMIPVLTNRMMLTESLPLPVRGAGTFTFSLDKLKNNKPGRDEIYLVSTMKNYSLTLEFASNPAWYAVQALPVLDDPGYPSADALFNAFYANSIAMNIANSDPAIRKVFESWKTISPEALLSNLQKNQELKTAVLEETPWVMEAKDEEQQKRAIGQLFDLNTIESKLVGYLSKLKDLQRPEGGWSWFRGMEPSSYTTRAIVTGFGRLSHLSVRDILKDKETREMLSKALMYMDRDLTKEFEWLKKNVKNYQTENHLSASDIQYLYARTYFLKDIPLDRSAKDAFEYYRAQSEKYWMKQDIYFQGMIALSLNRLGNKSVPGLIMKSLSEKALHSPEMGMYWAMQEGYYWYQAPVETQALLIEAYEEVLSDKVSVDEMKIWLLKQKQTTSWKTGRATADACYALLLRGTSLLTANQKVTFEVGRQKIDPSTIADLKTEAGTGYFKMRWNGSQITPEMGDVKVTKTGDGVAWGALYWQYFEDLDKITPAQSPLKLEKKVFLEKNTPSGPVLEPVTSGTSLKTGDKLKIRIVVISDRELEFVHLKDMRASALEPVISESVSGYMYQEGLGYYQSVSDVAMNFFFDYLPKGTRVFEYPLVVNAAGNYSNGVTTIQCMYAPEFGAHSEGIRVEVR